MRAILNLPPDDRNFVKATYKYSIATLPRPQDKNKTRDEVPQADEWSYTLQKKLASSGWDFWKFVLQ